MSGSSPATRAAAVSALAVLASQTLPGAVPLHARLSATLAQGDNETAASGATNQYTSVVIEVNRYLFSPS
jgi:hypothetical protein